jgi:HEPN domain-containing protein
MEKTLKALMVAKRQEIRKTHDISLLVALVRPLWPELIPPHFPIVELSEWYLVSRYPGLEEVALAASDVMAALNLVSDFMTVVRGYGPPDRP